MTRIRLFLLCCLCGALLFHLSARATEFSLSIADVVGPAFSARGIVLSLPENGSADLSVRALRVQQRDYQNVRIHCATLELSTAQLRCRGGSLNEAPGMVLEFSYETASRRWQFAAQLRNTPASRLAAFLPAEWPQPGAGTLSGTVEANGAAASPAAVSLDLHLAGVGFSDASGLHAAEKLRGSFKFGATRRGARWSWQGALAWDAGDMFWQPLFLRGGPRVSASGSFDGTLVKVEQAVAELPDGRIQGSAGWDIKKNILTECALHGSKLVLGKLFAEYAKPFLDKGALADSELSGTAEVDWQYRNGATEALHLTLRDAGVADAAGRFALNGVTTDLDWRATTQTTAEIAFTGGKLFDVAFGGGKLPVRMRGFEVDVPQAELSVLDGKLELSDFQLRREDGQWRWQFAAALSRISMERFSATVGWPLMHGSLAARIPTIAYDGKEIKADGALLFNLFDGTVVATQLKLADPFGLAPRLYGNLSMRDLDLDLLTRTFSFGNMQGRIDVDVKNLILEDWQPVQFDARVFSSAGNYPKKISQKAVENISSLGGAGALAALQRSYLSFFKNFGYERLGWSCRLRRGVCEMGGVDGGNGVAYVLVQGGGIPAITVMGYNRNVGWDELLTRLKRVMQSNVKPVVK